jgi:serine protease inhibitor
LTEVEKLHLQDSIQLKELLEKTDKHPHRRVHVQLPKFQIKHKVDVRRTLRKQGITDVFNPLRADFSRMSEQGIHNYNRESQEQGHTSSYERRNPFTTQYDSEFETDNYMRQGGENKVHLNKFIHQCTIKITEQGITAVTGNQAEEQYEQFEGMMGGRRHHQQQEQYESEENMFEQYSGIFRRGEFEQSTNGGQQQHVVKANRAFAFVLKHNPTKQLVMVGRVIDAAQKKINQVPHTINGVDQY